LLAKQAIGLLYSYSGGVTIKRRFFRPEKQVTNLPKVNDEIKSKEVRLINEEGNQIGIVTIKEAIRMTRETGLDLVEISPNSSPPVCKMMDFGRYKYDLRKKERESRKKQKQIEVKQLTMRLNIEDHDLKIKTNHAIEFLKDDNKVKFILRLRGREIGNKEKASALFDKILEFLGDTCTVEKQPDYSEKQVVMIVAPVKK